MADPALAVPFRMAVRAEGNLESHAAPSAPAVDLTINPHQGRGGGESEGGGGQRSAVGSSSMSREVS